MAWGIGVCICFCYEINCSVTMMLSRGWSVGGYKEVGKKAGAGNQLEVRRRRRSCPRKVAGSGFLNSLVPKKVSAQQIADEITRLLSLFPNPARQQSDSFALQLRLTRGKSGIYRPVWGISATE